MVSIRKSQHLTIYSVLCGMAEGVGNGFVECRLDFCASKVR